ncbi:MAG TPA: ATP-dependent DNA ligase [Thermoanaerobaculia bacterium]|nr:ATP-dependent DNA ligase [Thermoanaerobaculia bacterium]
MLARFAETASAIAATRKKGEKEAILAAYLASLDDASLERAAVFFAGAPFPRREERVTGVGWATVAAAVSEVTGATREEISRTARVHGDPGDGVAELFPAEHAATAAGEVTVLELGETFDALAAAVGPKAKGAILVGLMRRLHREETRWVVKIAMGEFRIGLQEGLVESAIAKAFSRRLPLVRRAHMFNGDLGATALLARAGTLEGAAMSLFHPIGFMLAQPEADPAAIIEQLGPDALADDKYDGIRAQIHTDGERVRIYSRTLDEIGGRFPELAAAATALPVSCVLDGEIVAFRDGILPFATLQTRIGRRKPSDRLLEEAPAAFFAFDLLYADGEALFEVPLRERLARLRSIVSPAGPVRLGFQTGVASGEEVDAAFDAARRRRNEGLVVKDPASLYTPGRRGKSWLKYKKALATLDCVVTAAEYGHGRRRGVLSDYTFAVRGDAGLLNIGKAYSGLTDVEIERLTARFRESTLRRHGPVHLVRPEVVLEIAFDRIQESKRHKSGYALRFPRIARIRDDKSVDEISTLDEVRRIHRAQQDREGA